MYKFNTHKYIYVYIYIYIYIRQPSGERPMFANSNANANAHADSNRPRMEKSNRLPTNKSISIFLVLAGSRSSLSEITEYIYFSLL